MAPTLSTGTAAKPPPSGPGASILVGALPFCAIGAYGLWQALRGDVTGAADVVAALVFGVLGVAMLVFWRHGATRDRELAALYAAYPERPWLWRPDWAGGRILSEANQGARPLWIAGGAWTLMLLPILVMLPEIYAESGAVPVGFVLVFTAVGVGMLAAALRFSLRERRFGRCVFEPASLPGVPGARLTGVIQLSVPLAPKSGFEIALRCTNRAEDGRGRESPARTRWRAAYALAAAEARPGPRGVSLPIDFAIPPDVPPSTPPSGADDEDAVVWYLEASAGMPGMDFLARFEVPVHRGARSSAGFPDQAPPKPPLPELAAGADPAPVAAGSPVTAAGLPGGGVEIRLPAGRDNGTAVGLGVAAAAWNGLLYGLMLPSCPHVPIPVTLLFVAIPGAIGLLIVYAALDTWLGSTRLRAQRGSIEVADRLLGWTHTRRFAGSELAPLSVGVGARAGSKVSYAVEMPKPGGTRKRILAKGIGDRRVAERLVLLIERACGQSSNRFS